MGEKKRRQAAGDLRGGDARAAISRALDLLRSGRPHEALASCEPLFDAPLRDAEALHYLGYLAIELGRPERAVGVMERAIREQPSNAHLYNTLAIAFQRQAQPEPAVAALERAVALAPGLHEPFGNLGNSLRVLGRYAEAAACYRRAMQLAPHVGGYRSAFADALSRVAGTPDPELRRDLLESLAHEEVDPKTLVRSVMAILRQSPGFVALERLCRSEEGLSLETLAAHCDSLEDPLLLRALEQTVIGDPGLERLLARVRRLLLEHESRGDAAPTLSLEFACALAHQCFATEYAWSVAPEELDLLPAVRARAFSSPGSPAAGRALALLAAYGPLHAEPRAQALTADSGPLRALVQRQLLEPREEARLRALVPSLDPVDDEISRAVQAQYETHPYPRWVRLGRFDHARPLSVVLGELFPLKRLQAPADPLRILIAGCGTGSHSVRTALRFQNATILALDLSRVSLAHALRKTRELGIDNIEYMQADLLGLGRLGRTFGLIECMGVLHHLRDPLEGWRSLLGLLAQDGYLRIGLYSELGRSHIVRGQAFAKAGGYASTDDGIRRLRQDLLAAAASDADLAKVTQIRDFHSLSGTRDLLLHVQEHRFTVPELARALELLGLEFLGFELPGPDAARRYRARFPANPAMDDLVSWQAFEESEPETFAGMYQFWTRRARGR
jgi:SAM-dependent methyltransferase